MDRKYMGGLYTVTVFACLVLLVSCRSAKWHLDKAVAKGLEIDTTTKIYHDTVSISDQPFDHTFDVLAENRVDTVVVKELCAEPVKSLKNKKFSRTVCPQLDSTYQISVEVADTLYHFPIYVRLMDGTYLFKTTTLKIPIVSKAETNLSFTPPPAGYRLATLLLWAGLAFTIGVAVALLAVITRTK